MKYLATFKQSVQYFLVYRWRVIIWVVNDSVNFLIFPFIWLAIYGSQETIGSYSKADIVTYFLVIIIVKLVSDSHISNSMKEDVIEGRLNFFLVRPVNFIFSRCLHEISYKIFSSIFYIPLLLIISFLFRQYLVLPQSLGQILLFLASLFIAFILSTVFQFIIGFACFWLGNNSAPNRINHLADLVFSGRIAPLVFFPPILGFIASILPFQYISYFPTQIFLGQMNMQETLIGFLYAIIWIVVAWSIAYIMWRRGLRIYEGVGI